VHPRPLRPYARAGLLRHLGFTGTSRCAGLLETVRIPRTIWQNSTHFSRSAACVFCSQQRFQCASGPGLALPWCCYAPAEEQSHALCTISSGVLPHAQFILVSCHVHHPEQANTTHWCSRNTQLAGHAVFQILYLFMCVYVKWHGKMELFHLDERPWNTYLCVLVCA